MLPADKENNKPEELFYAAMTVPDSMMERVADYRQQRHYITAMEELAIAAVYHNEDLFNIMKGRHVIHCGDNTAANCAVIKGYSAAPDLARLVSATHLKWAEGNINVWLEFVKSEANVSDLPSRGEFESLDKIGAIRLMFTLPDISLW